MANTIRALVPDKNNAQIVNNNINNLKNDTRLFNEYESYATKNNSNGEDIK